MRHCKVTRLLAFVIAGAIVSIAVAWACAFWMRSPTFRLSHAHEKAKVEKQLGVRRGDRRHDFIHLQYPGRHDIYVDRGASRIRSGRVGQVRQAGWPMLCLRGTLTRHTLLPDVLSYLAEVPHSLWDPMDFVEYDREQRLFVISRPMLPFIPIWPGFAINTIFYGAILWLLFVSPGKVRRWRRMRRGLCARCAYPIGSNEVCTECGAAIPGSRPEVARRCSHG